MWSKKQIENHQKAARLLLKIEKLAFNYIRDSREISEWGGATIYFEEV